MDTAPAADHGNPILSTPGWERYTAEVHWMD
jgi:hypothetical protein